MMKIVRQVLMIFLLLLSIKVQAYAVPIVEQSEIKVTQIEVIANVPEQFTKEITVNFTLDNGTNALYTLNKANRYRVEGVIPIGNHTLNFININGNTGEYKISSPGAVGAYEGKKSTFKMDITINPDMVQDNKTNTNSNKNIGGNKTQEYLESTLIKDDNKNNEVEKETEDKDKQEKQEKVEEKNDEEKEDGDKKSIIKVFLKKWFSAVLLLIVLSIFGVIFIIRKRVL